jgi:hypothetical protein
MMNVRNLDAVNWIGFNTDLYFLDAILPTYTIEFYFSAISSMRIQHELYKKDITNPQRVLLIENSYTKR